MDRAATIKQYDDDLCKAITLSDVRICMHVCNTQMPMYRTLSIYVCIYNIPMLFTWQITVTFCLKNNLRHRLLQFSLWIFTSAYYAFSFEPLGLVKLLKMENISSKIFISIWSLIGGLHKNITSGASVYYRYRLQWIDCEFLFVHVLLNM